MRPSPICGPSGRITDSLGGSRAALKTLARRAAIG